ncbi:MAG: hypothetical protein QOG19_2062 [Mycobacterium sp.]|nr:hypothetical protein [Mycobacterium sp.]
MANRRGTAAGVVNKVADSVRVPGVYRSVLHEWCRQEIVDSGSYAVRWLSATDDPVKLAQWESEVTTLAGLLFDERIVLGEPVVAWWYWLPKLPPPLHRVGRADGPRHARVSADDLVTPAASVGPGNTAARAARHAATPASRSPGRPGPRWRHACGYGQTRHTAAHPLIGSVAGETPGPATELPNREDHRQWLRRSNRPPARSSPARLAQKARLRSVAALRVLLRPRRSAGPRSWPTSQQ